MKTLQWNLLSILRPCHFSLMIKITWIFDLHTERCQICWDRTWKSHYKTLLLILENKCFVRTFWKSFLSETVPWMNHRAELLPLQISQSFLWLFQYLPTGIQVASDSYSDLRGEIKTKKERRFGELILGLTWAHDCITMLTPHTLTDWLTDGVISGWTSISVKCTNTGFYQPQKLQVRK